MSPKRQTAPEHLRDTDDPMRLAAMQPDDDEAEQRARIEAAGARVAVVHCTGPERDQWQVELELPGEVQELTRVFKTRGAAFREAGRVAEVRAKQRKTDAVPG